MKSKTSGAESTQRNASALTTCTFGDSSERSFNRVSSGFGGEQPRHLGIEIDQHDALDLAGT